MALVDELQRNKASLGGRALAAICLYEGRQMPSLHPLAYYTSGLYGGPDYNSLVWNIPRSLAQTVQAKIAGLNKTKVQFVVTEGDWKTKRKAHRLDQFVEAQFYAPQGSYPDVWQLMQRICLDALVIPGGGFAKVDANYDAGHVEISRVFAWELYVDPDDARHGMPRTMVHRFPYDADALIERFPEHKDAILRAPHAEDPGADYRSSTRAVKQIWVYEAWRLGSAKKPGTRSLCINDCELEEDEWELDRFPFVRLIWAGETIGWGCQSLMEEVSVINDEVNHTIQRMQEGERKLANGVVIAPKGAVDIKTLESNEIGKIIEWDPAESQGAQVQYFAPPGFAETTLNWMQLNARKMYELPGISEMAATSRKEPGVDAAVAMRTMQDIQTERFSVFENSYECAFVDLARLIVAMVRRLAENSDDNDVIASWPGQRFLRQLKWSDCDLPDDQYVIRPDPVSGIKNTPADRLQLAQDLMQAGVIAPDAFARVVQYLDTPGEFQRVNKQREWVEMQIEAWLDAYEGDDYIFHPPIKFMVLEDALLQVVEAYFGALVDGAPDYNLGFFLQWMESCDRELQERAQQAAAVQTTGMAAHDQQRQAALMQAGQQGPGPAPPPGTAAAEPGIPPNGAMLS